MTRSMEKLSGTSPVAAVEAFAAMKAVIDFGLAGEAHVAVLDHHYDVYLVHASWPGKSIVFVTNPDERGKAVAVDIGSFSDGSAAQKLRAARAAAAAMKLTLFDIHVVP